MTWLSWTLLVSTLGPQDTVTWTLSRDGVPTVHRLGWVPFEAPCTLVHSYSASRLNGVPPTVSDDTVLEPCVTAAYAKVLTVTLDQPLTPVKVVAVLAV